MQRPDPTQRPSGPQPEAEADIDFRQAVGDVRPRPASDRVEPPRRQLSTRPLSSEADERAVLAELLDDCIDPEAMESGDVLIYRGGGIQDSVWRRLRRGGYRISAELDLHGLNRDKARQEVTEFLAYCQDRDLRAVRIIHGKGNGSPNTGPVIKALLDGWLRKRKDVLAFCSARPHDGGTGAVYVLLRASHTPAASR
jgi:DNA-nicking Smr family endonuclease